MSSGGGWPRPPSGRRPMAPERAGPEQPDRRVETPALSEAKGTARLRPPLWPARSHAQARPRAALDAPPERHGRSPRGKTRRPHAVKKETTTRGTGTRESLSAVEERRPPGRDYTSGGSGGTSPAATSAAPSRPVT